jgi:hypothetical protein
MGTVCIYFPHVLAKVNNFRFLISEFEFLISNFRELRNAMEKKKPNSHRPELTQLTHNQTISQFSFLGPFYYNAFEPRYNDTCLCETSSVTSYGL